MAKLSFNDIIDKEKGKTAIVIGLGPSLNGDIETIKGLYDNDDYILIGCNDYDLMTDLYIDYWVHANSIDTVGKNHKRYNSRDSLLVYADSVDSTNKILVDRLLSVDYLAYDQRHFNGMHCTWGKGTGGRHICCGNMEEGRLTIQEELMRYTNHEKHYGGGDTVALHMVSLAILLGCKEIFLTGIDLDYSKGYINGGKSFDSFNQYLPRILDDFTIIKDSANSVDVNVFITSDQTYLTKVIGIKNLSN